MESCIREGTSPFRWKKPHDVTALLTHIVIRFFVEKIKSKKRSRPGIQECMTNSETVMVANRAIQFFSCDVILIGMKVAHDSLK